LRGRRLGAAGWRLSSCMLLPGRPSSTEVRGGPTQGHCFHWTDTSTVFQEQLLWQHVEPPSCAPQAREHSSPPICTSPVKLCCCFRAWPHLLEWWIGGTVFHSLTTLHPTACLQDRLRGAPNVSCRRSRQRPLAHPVLTDAAESPHAAPLLRGPWCAFGGRPEAAPGATPRAPGQERRGGAWR